MRLLLTQSTGSLSPTTSRRHEPTKLALLLLPLNCNLLADLLLDLLEGLQEELLDFRTLVEHYLGQSADILELPVLVPQVFLQVYNIFLLLLDNLLMLELQQLLFFLEVVNNLLE